MAPIKQTGGAFTFGGNAYTCVQAIQVFSYLCFLFNLSWIKKIDLHGPCGRLMSVLPQQQTTLELADTERTEPVYWTSATSAANCCGRADKLHPRRFKRHAVAHQLSSEGADHHARHIDAMHKPVIIGGRSCVEGMNGRIQRDREG